ncbi:MAG: hypothetical protein DLM59_20450 [Pseudonocardiales bacterium]|nr:MAG: hypothetical protein DLM59_20450 [Pseudonocardiales bacterium]
MTVARDVAIGLGIGLLLLIVTTVLRVVRGRPPQPRRSRKMPPYYRSGRGLTAGLMKEHRRRGQRSRRGR